MDQKDDFLLRVLKAVDHPSLQENIWLQAPDEALLYLYQVRVFVNCNDLFAWACADTEEVTRDNIDLFEQSIGDALCADSTEGCQLFACRVRGMRPQTPWYRNLNQKMTALYNACGPPRDV